MTEIENYRSALNDALGKPIPLQGDLRIWLDPNPDERPAPDGWVHLRTVREVCLLILQQRVLAVSVRDNLSDPRPIDQEFQVEPEVDPDEEIPEPVPPEVEFGRGRQVLEFVDALRSDPDLTQPVVEFLSGSPASGQGRQVVDFIEEMNGVHGRLIVQDQGVTLHTANSAGRDTMARAMETLERSTGFEMERSRNGNNQPHFRLILPEA